MEYTYIENNEEAKYITEHVFCSFDEANRYVEAEYNYLKGKGLVVYSEEEFNAVPFKNVIIEPEDMCEYISKVTGLDLELCNCMDNAGFMFLVDKGLISRNKDVDEEYELCKSECIYKPKVQKEV